MKEWVVLIIYYFVILDMISSYGGMTWHSGNILGLNLSARGSTSDVRKPNVYRRLILTSKIDPGTEGSETCIMAVDT